MDSCCKLKYQTVFDAAGAKKEMADYLSKGIKKSSRPLAEMLKTLPLENRTLLDIGAGIGALIFESFGKGLKKATYVDIAAAYRQTFLQEVKQRALEAKVKSQLGDFVELHQHIDQTDLVTLDKVICCYEDFNGLVRHSVAKAQRWYVYTIPRDVWWVHLVHHLEGWFNKIRGKDFRTYIHPPQEIEKIVEAAGFTQVGKRHQREWEVVLYERN